MSAPAITVPGIIQQDGQLRLDRPVRLPAGPVQVTIQPVSPTTEPVESLEAVMKRVWAGQKARGHVPRSKEEIDTGIRALRDEAEEEMQAVEKLDRARGQARDGLHE